MKNWRNKITGQMIICVSYAPYVNICESYVQSSSQSYVQSYDFVDWNRVSTWLDKQLCSILLDAMEAGIFLGSSNPISEKL